MHTFGVFRSWVVKLIGRHPLVRASDRAEARLMLLAIFVAMLAIPVAGAVGTSVHDVRAKFYAEQAASRHTVTATAIEDTTTVVRPDAVSFNVRARWDAAGTNHIDTISWPKRAKAGDREAIWVDSHGRQAPDPAAPGRAGLDAVGAAVSLWLVVAAAMVTLAYAVRSRLDRARFAAWDRLLGSPTDGDSADDDRRRRNRYS
ncbi:hypothetical protein [Mycobacterium sp. URHB0044]|jgi:hypothetical protein|uniref:Rv1733c family protein n=1 Tax=Mycobacterium sp. URHB0044 TaxID=1380386 RepID=UPI000688B45D|nr:hypothetical protein [Mycobacterium sp. URHB0044]